MFNNMKYPIIQAPMAGGISNEKLAIAVSKSGGLGFLAAGYKTPEAIEKEILACQSSNFPFGVNIFVPSNDPITKKAEEYKALLEEDFNINLNLGKASDDYWAEKITLVKQYQVPYVSFTFGCPTVLEIEELQKAGCKTIITVTNIEEAKLAQLNGADAICIQGMEAGGHRATFQNIDDEQFTPLANQIYEIKQEVTLPIIAAGGIMNGKDIQLALAAGASAVQLGTAFLCTEESGANPTYKKALLSHEFTETAITRAFTGRRARGLKNHFMEKYSEIAPAVYPTLHYITQPIRQKALIDENPQAMSLWASTRFKEIREGRAEEIMAQLISECWGKK